MITIDLDKVDACCKPIKSEHEAYWQRHYEESQQMRIRIMRENRVSGEYMEIATEALSRLGCRAGTHETEDEAFGALAKIKQRLAQLEEKAE